MAYTSDLALSALSGEEKLFLERIRDLVELCDQRGIPRFSAFLDERQQRIALSAGALPGVTCGFWGGFPDAERKMFYALPDYCSPEDESLFPIRVITAEFPRQYSLTHRDFLGALMNLGLRREAIGDILVGEGRAVLFLWETVADLVLSELSKAGRVGLRLTEGCPEELPAAHAFQEIAGTVSSMRLDCVAALLIRESRDQTARLIRSGLVTVNSAVEESVSFQIHAGDKIAVRGHGKFLVSEIGAPTKKDRLHITCQKYI